MKIGILTFRWADNYGAVLQAYALSSVLRSLGHDVEFLNYIPQLHRRNWIANWGLRSMTFSKMVPLRLAFMQFRRKYLPATPIASTMGAIGILASRHDAWIVGSDQVWNGKLHNGYDPVYFLDFGNHVAPLRISYAACFGEPEQPKDSQFDIRKHLVNFTSISVRNRFSGRLVSQIADRESDVVLDPTFLWGFGELIPPLQGRVSAKTSEYILVYALSADHREMMETVVGETVRQTGLDVICIWPTAHLQGTASKMVYPGPIGWLSLFKNAKYICTDSFHGCCFAIKFGKQLLCWSGARSQRITELLMDLGMTGRLMQSDSPSEVTAQLAHETDYRPVHLGLQERTSESLDFLKRSLSDRR